MSLARVRGALKLCLCQRENCTLPFSVEGQLAETHDQALSTQSIVRIKRSVIQ